MNTPNIGWLYFKDYLRINGDPTKLFFERIKWEQEEKEKKNDAKSKNFDRFFNGFKDDDGNYHSGKNQTILEQEFNKSLSVLLSVVSPKEKLRFKTTYPGLTLGTGYTHEINELGEFKLGFFFDHTTGYPCIPGSTVKGCLRSMFPQKEHNDVADKYNYMASVIRELSNLKNGFINEYELGAELDQKEHPKREKFIDRLEMEIFEGKKPAIKENGTSEFQSIGVYERDIFFDAYLLAANHPAISRSSYQNSKPFIGDDYITPHINRKNPKMSPFTNPIPLMFLKILPEVTIQFQFDVKDGLLTKEQKEALFHQLLLDFGIGAKTNVGYGQFCEVFQYDKPMVKNLIRYGEPKSYVGRIKNGSPLEAKVVDQDKKKVKVVINGKEIILDMSGICPENDSLVLVKVNGINKKEEILSVGFLGEKR